ncbi:hypothetical protein [Chryseobacterium indologenes]|nr:hypothetical protein [Chryseobacterium indologenes]
MIQLSFSDSEGASHHTPVKFFQFKGRKRFRQKVLNKQTHTALKEYPSGS